jgi:lysophospholipase L1-like esterase
VVLDGNGRVYNNTSGQSVYNVPNAGGPASADYDVFADFFYAGGTRNYADVVARLNTGSFDGYLGGWNDNNGTWTIYRGASVKASGPSYTLVAGATYRLQLSLRGGAITLYVNGVQQCTWTDPSPISGAGAVGLYFYGQSGSGSGVHIGNLQAADPGSPATGLSLAGPSFAAEGAASSAYSVALSPSGSSVSGTVTVTPSDGGAGGSFTPASIALTTASPGATFTYTNTRPCTASINVTNNGGIANPTQSIVTYVQQRSQVVCDGDSLTYGVGATHGSSDYPTVMTGLLNSSVWSVGGNLGVSGQPVGPASQNPSMLYAAAQSSGIDSLYDAGKAANVCLCWGGNNDIRLGADAPTVLGRLQSYCASRRAAGWKVLVFTILPCTGSGYASGFEAIRNALNISLRATWHTFCDGLVDVAADSRIGVLGEEQQSTYYYTDHIHLNPAGYAIVADYAAAAVSQALGQGGLASGGFRRLGMTGGIAG